jgi:mono/diheme cytochrome c family protein
MHREAQEVNRGSRLRRALLRHVAPIAALMTALAAGMAVAVAAGAQPDMIERGDYLINGILICGNCHTKRGPAGEIMPAAEIRGKAFSGGQSWDEPSFRVTAPNITQDRQTGIGDYTDAELKRLLRKGIKRNGAPVALMPSGFYEIMTDRDLDAVIAYLRTIAPVSNATPAAVYRTAQVPPGGESPYSEAMLSDRVTRGFYLATIGLCMECHTPMAPNGQDFANRIGAGGIQFEGPWGISVSRNITANRIKGIGGWTDDEIKRAITQGISRDGSRLKPPMSFQYYANVSAADLDAIVAYLRTVPSQE